MNRFTLFIALFALVFPLYLPALAQDVANIRKYNLGQVVELAKTQSPNYRYAAVLFENKKWQYKNYRSNFYPQLNLGGTLPEYNKTIEPYLNPDGRLTFINTHNANSSLNLSLGQELWFTGGYISINSQIKRIDDFQASLNTTRYSSVPATITLSQPLFGYKWLIWERKMQPLRFEEAKREFKERMESISVEATGQFFSLLISQISYQIARKNVANSEDLYKIALVRFNEGKTPENELLQMELTLLNARQYLEQTALDVESSTLRLKVYLGITDDELIQLIPPIDIPAFEVNEKIAIEQAHINRQRILGFERELLEAKQNLARAKGETGISANLFASFGLTQQALRIPEAYQDPSQQQRLRVGFNIPIMDWGRADARLGTATANQDLVTANVEQQKVNFDQDIYLTVKRFKVLRTQLVVAKRTDEIAERRYILTKEQYLKDKIKILDLNVATEERDKATRSYISSLSNFWTAFYQLRQSTLYDFELNQAIY